MIMGVFYTTRKNMIKLLYFSISYLIQSNFSVVDAILWGTMLPSPGSCYKNTIASKVTEIIVLVVTLQIIHVLLPEAFILCLGRIVTKTTYPPRGRTKFQYFIFIGHRNAM